MKSLWEQTWAHPNFGRLESDEITDVLIIGGGMAGVLCAYFLQQAGIATPHPAVFSDCGKTSVFHFQYIWLHRWQGGHSFPADNWRSP